MTRLTGPEGTGGGKGGRGKAPPRGLQESTELSHPQSSLASDTEDQQRQLGPGGPSEPAVHGAGNQESGRCLCLCMVTHGHTWSLGPESTLSGQLALGVSHQPIWRGLALRPTRSAGPLLAGAHSALPGSLRLNKWSLAWGSWEKHRWPFWQLEPRLCFSTVWVVCKALLSTAFH